MNERARYLRQIMLAEVGTEGQARIHGGTAKVSGPGLAHEIAERYARGAGFSSIEPGTFVMDELAPDTIITSPVCREVCAGARAALSAMREAVQIPIQKIQIQKDWTGGSS